MLYDPQRGQQDSACTDINIAKVQKDIVLIGEGVGFERTRRITGYLVGTLDRFNNAKRSEERDRVKHGV